ncbi:MAG: RNA polymerase sigma factor RpoD/SigA [Candidatus Omnitrophica bacterium]|nr:RNA polymerase sigma factor RpoD/SigA [Candidatus Omnitrophota bacterium]HOX55223.1 RNA polymerase sigma factor RpoD/SigA [Candidatus Omnitrophota bacterium]
MAESIKTYLKEIRHIPLLKPHEEIDLAKRIKRGDKHARAKMIRSNLRLVINIAKRYMNFGIPFMDLIEEGNIGLMRAVDKFNPKKGFRFSTYAAWWIKQSITRAIIEQGKIIRIPVYMSENISKWKKTTDKLTTKLKRKPTEQEVAKKMKLSLEKIRDIDKWTAKMSSLEAPIGEDKEGQVKDIIEDESLAAPDEELETFLDKERIRDLLGFMNKKQRKVLDLRFGLSNGESHTLAQIAKKMGVSRERVRQIEEVALRKLKTFITQQEKQTIDEEEKDE